MMMLREGLDLQALKKIFGSESGDDIYCEVQEDFGSEAENCLACLVEPVENQLERLRAAKMRIYGS